MTMSDEMKAQIPRAERCPGCKGGPFYLGSTYVDTKDCTRCWGTGREVPILIPTIFTDFSNLSPFYPHWTISPRKAPPDCIACADGPNFSFDGTTYLAQGKCITCGDENG